jgi:hypothetical protein
MLEAVPRGWFSNDYKVVQNGIQLVDFHRRWFRERGNITVEGTTYTIRREGGIGAFVLESNGEVLVRARKPHAFTRTFEIDYNGTRYILRAQSAWRRTFVLQRGSEVIGSMRPKGTWSRNAVIDFPTLPLHVAMFLAWLVIILWQREEGAASAGAVAASI